MVAGSVDDERQLEFIELFNRGDRAVDLDGYSLQQAVDYGFTSRAVIPPGGYLVVAADPATIPNTSMTGPVAA